MIPVLSVMTPNSLLEFGNEPDSSSYGVRLSTISKARQVGDHRDHQYSVSADRDPSVALFRTYDNIGLPTSLPQSSLSFDMTLMSSSSSLSVASRSTPAGFYPYDDIVKPHEQKLSKSKSKSTSSSVSSADSRVSSESSGHGSRSDRRRSGSISISLRGLNRKNSARVPDVPPPPLPSTTPAADPMSPTLDEDAAAEAERRLRQLHKVSRTLGENIPAELILGPKYKGARDQTPSSTRTGRRASLSLSSLAYFKPPTSHSPSRKQPASKPTTPPSRDFEPTYTYPKPPRLNANTNTNQPESVSPIAFADAEESTPPPTASYLVPNGSMQTEQRSRPSVTISRSKSSRSLRRQSTYEDDHGYLRPETPFQDSTMIQHDTKSGVWITDPNGTLVRREKRQGWSGEWNQHDMQDVISKLRNLK